MNACFLNLKITGHGARYKHTFQQKSNEQHQADNAGVKEPHVEAHADFKTL